MRVLIQHHPSRAALLPTFADLDPIIVADPAPSEWPSAWRTYLACLETAASLADDHVVILQDDCVPCPRFVELAAVAFERHPDDLVCFYHPPFPRAQMLLMRRCGDAFLLLRQGWAPAVALGWPTYRVREMLADLPRMRIPPTKLSDDGVIGSWCRGRVPVYATTPSLVEHPDVEPSLLRRETRANRVPRLAAAFVGDDPDSWLRRVASSPQSALP